jgi:hypothetical protein
MTYQDRTESILLTKTSNNHVRETSPSSPTSILGQKTATADATVIRITTSFSTRL